MSALFGRLPTAIRGRDRVLAELRKPLGRGRRSGGVWILAGTGGLGKPTVALATAKAAQVRGWLVWWVTATDTASLTGGMLEVLRQVKARHSRPASQGRRSHGAATSMGDSERQAAWRPTVASGV